MISRWPKWIPLNPSLHHSIIVLRALMAVLNWAPFITIDGNISQSGRHSLQSGSITANFNNELLSDSYRAQNQLHRIGIVLTIFPHYANRLTALDIIREKLRTPLNPLRTILLRCPICLHRTSIESIYIQTHIYTYIYI